MPECTIDINAKSKSFEKLGEESESESFSAEIKTTLVSRNITVFDKRTSIRLEPEMWKALKEISERENCTIHDVCTLISLRKREKTSLTAAIRVFLMLYYKAAATDEGHKTAGHGDFRHMLSRARVSEEARIFFKKTKIKPSTMPRQNHGAVADVNMASRYLGRQLGNETARNIASA